MFTEGGNIFKSQYTNNGSAPGFVGLTAKYPAQIIPVFLDSMQGSVVCELITFTLQVCPNHNK